MCVGCAIDVDDVLDVGQCENHVAASGFSWDAKLGDFSSDWVQATARRSGRSVEKILGLAGVNDHSGAGCGRLWCLWRPVPCR